MCHPLHLAPLLVEKPWGGRRLASFGRSLPDGVAIGESWEVADLDPSATSVEDPVTRVAAGPHTGQRLQDLIALDRDALLGDAPDLDGRFPLLVKLLDAHEHLSVQVHPPDDYVAEHPDVNVKTESWVVLDAEPGSQLMIGVGLGVTPAILAGAVGTPGMVPLLRRVPAVPGEVHHLPAGTIHALGAGVIVAEVQTPSDTTFRVYDWAEKYGRTPRDLHLEEALRSIEFGWEHNVTPAASPASPIEVDSTSTSGPTASTLVETPHYRLTRSLLEATEECSITAGEMRIVQVLDGVLDGDGFAWPVPTGGTVVLPAAWSGALRASRPTVWLETTVPTAPRP